MSIQSALIQKDIGSLIVEKSAMAEGIIKSEVEDFKKCMQNGFIAIDGPACEHSIRNIRKNALNQYRNTKLWLNANILNIINQHNRSEALQELSEKLKETAEAQASKKKAEEQIKRITEKDMKLKDYDKFLLYGDVSLRKKDISKKGDALPEYLLSGAIVQKQKNYKKKRWISLLTGVVATFFFAALDYNIIFSVFQSSNLGLGVSRISAFITASALDLPPYILGLLLSKRNDCSRLWFLRDDPNDPGARNELKGYEDAMKLLFAVSIMIFLAYFALRVLLFFGGGDFNVVIHSIFEQTFKFEDSEFSSSDLISTFVPFVTSAVAFAVGLMASSSYTDHVKGMITLIDSELNHCIRKYRELIIDCEKKTDNLQLEILELKQSIWASYIGSGAPFPNDDLNFIAQVTDACNKLNFSTYMQAYEASCAQIRNTADSMIRQINMQLSPYAANQLMLTSMDVSSEENAILDEIWVVSNDRPQCSATAKTIVEIEIHIKQFQEMLKNSYKLPVKEKGENT